MTATTPAQRKAAERERYRQAGLVAVTVYVDPADREAVRRYANRLTRRRVGKKSPTEFSTTPPKAL